MTTKKTDSKISPLDDSTTSPFGDSTASPLGESTKPKIDLDDEKLKADPVEKAEDDKADEADKAGDEKKDEGDVQLPNIPMNAAGFYDADHAAPGDYNLPPSFGPVKRDNDDWRGPATLKKAEEQAKEKEAKEKQGK